MTDDLDQPPESSSPRVLFYGIGLLIVGLLIGLLVVVLPTGRDDYTGAALASGLVFLGCLLVTYDHFRSRR